MDELIPSFGLLQLRACEARGYGEIYPGGSRWEQWAQSFGIAVGSGPHFRQCHPPSSDIAQTELGAPVDLAAVRPALRDFARIHNTGSLTLQGTTLLGSSVNRGNPRHVSSRPFKAP
jgi:hypothetical protein